MRRFDGGIVNLLLVYWFLFFFNRILTTESRMRMFILHKVNWIVYARTVDKGIGLVNIRENAPRHYTRVTVAEEVTTLFTIRYQSCPAQWELDAPQCSKNYVRWYDTFTA